MQLPVFLLCMMLPRQNIKFVIAANVSLPYKRKHFYPVALSWMLNAVHWQTRACKKLAQLARTASQNELLERARASMHVFSSECITSWKEIGCASSMTHLKFCRGRPLSMDRVAYSSSYSSSYQCLCTLGKRLVRVHKNKSMKLPVFSSSFFFCYGCCHGGISGSSSLWTSVCTKKEKLFSSSTELHVEHRVLTNTCMQSARPA